MGVLIGLFAVLIAGMTLLGTGGAGRAAGPPPTIRYFVVQSSGYFEVLTGSAGGGKCIKQNRGKALNGKAIVGYTDRAMRGETVYTQVDGSGIVSGTTEGITRAAPTPQG